MIERTFTVPGAPERAFAVFADLASWWPKEYTWSQDVLDEIGIEPRAGGFCFERGPHGFRCDWGRVLTWEPPRRLVISWQISPRREPEPNPAHASAVELRFHDADNDATRVAFVHRDLARHGAGAEEYRAALDSPQGWDFILARYRKAAH